MSEMRLIPIIAIDGPTASGKGTVAQKVAHKLKFNYLDSGSLYRLVGLVSKELGVSFSQESQLYDIAKNLPVHFDGEKIFYKNQDVSDLIRTEEMGLRASAVGAIQAVRQGLYDFQRSFLTTPGLVADGRDMTTVIFPEAQLKVFLTADVAIRAERRYKQLIAKGISANILVLTQDLEERDARDIERTASPLTLATGAKMLDTSHLTVEQAVRQILGWYELTEL
jgi:cytidylate kinase